MNETTVDAKDKTYSCIFIYAYMSPIPQHEVWIK